MNKISFSAIVIVILYILSGFSTSAFAQIDNISINAKDLLYDAKKATEQANFKSTTSIYKAGEIQKTVNLYRMKTQDGKMLEKVENISPNTPNEVYIYNEPDTYIFLGDLIMKANTRPPNRDVIYTSINEYNEKGATYSLATSENNYNGIPCYKVIVRFPTDKVSIEERVVKYWHNVKDTQKFINTCLPFTKTYLIDKDNHFIYSCAFYNLEDTKTFSQEWGDVDFNADIKSELFTIPHRDIPTLDKRSEKFKYVRRLFAIPSSDVNKSEAAKQISEKTKGDEASDKVRNLLFTAMKATARSTFSAKAVVYKGGKVYKTVTSYHNVKDDGTVQERVEYIWPNSWKETYIPTKNGAYVQINNVQVKANFKIGSRAFMYTSVKHDNIEDAVYSAIEEDYKKIPCYKITVKIPTDPDYVKQRLDRIQKYSKDSREVILEHLPFVRTFLVGKKNLFIYSCTFYNIQGRRTISEEWGDVIFNVPMNNSLFEVSKTPSLVANSRADFDRIKAKCSTLSKK